MKDSTARDTERNVGDAHESQPPAAANRRVEVTIAALFQDWKAAYERARAYLAALGAERSAQAIEAVERAVTKPEWRDGQSAFQETFRSLRQLLAGDAAGPAREDADERFFRWRLSRAAGEERGTLSSMPPLARGSMVPNRLEPNGFRLRVVSKRPAPSGRRRRQVFPWARSARRRRLVLAVLVLIPTVVASEFMIEVLPHKGSTALEMAIVVFFGALFGWISIGFWTAMAGFLLLLLRRDRFLIGDEGSKPDADLHPRARTAVVMPIYEEPVERVFAGLRTFHRSLERTGQLGRFDFFVLSDTADPDVAMREEEAWFEWCRAVGGFDHIFYRRRRVRVRRKSGNIADFCRRFGRRYRYMITLDADSLMSGETAVELVRRMQAHPEVGAIQTVPVPIRARSLYARIQQFTNRVYGPLFSTGLHFWQLGDSQYWGHNAILRVRPFMKHGALPRLPGKPPFGGEILSHDFVEAALLGRAGYSIWIAYDLRGSYEELPSSLLEDLQRDRRWCQGNLQHLRLVFVEGLFTVHRALFLNGILAYVSAMLWFCFLSLSTAEVVLEAISEPDYFPSGPSLFPEWPVWRPDWAISLLGVTMAILFLPKIFGIVLVLLRPRHSRAFGGFIGLVASALVEIVVSSLLAPIRMVFHTKFVLTNLLGRTVVWRSQGRGHQETSWGEAIRRHGTATVVASLWGLGVYWLNPEYFWWLTPIVAALIFSVPLSVWISRVRLGELARWAGLFLTPEEIDPPAEVADLERAIEAREAARAALPAAERDGFIRATVDPFVNAVHRALLRGPRRLRPSIHAARRSLAERARQNGPNALGRREQSVLLLDAAAVDELHRTVWELEDSDAARLWGRPGSRPAVSR